MNAVCPGCDHDFLDDGFPEESAVALDDDMGSDEPFRVGGVVFCSKSCREAWKDERR